MINVDELTANQATIGSKIQTLYKRISKDPYSRKTRKYLDQMTKELDSLFEQFQTNNEKLAPLEHSHESHPYFEQQYFDSISIIRKNVQTWIKKAEGKLSEEEDDDDEDSPGDSQPGGSQPGGSQPGDPQPGGSQEHDKKRLSKEIDSKKIHVMFETLEDNNELTRLVRKQTALMKNTVALIQDIESKAHMEHSQEYYKFKATALQDYDQQMARTDLLIWEIAEGDPPQGYTFDHYNELKNWLQDTIITLQQRLSSTTMGNSQGNSAEIKLPKITLPAFDGNYLKWTQFHDLYNQLIHSRPIGDAQKMYYLVSNLSGEAKRLVQHLPICNENYNGAWTIIKDRYNNKKLLVTHLLNKLLSQPASTSESSSAIRSLHDTTNECLMGLKNLGIAIDTWDPILLHLLIKKMDRHTHTLYEQSMESPKEISTIQIFLSFLEHRFQSLESLGTKSALLPRVVKPSSLVITPAARCIVCGEGHPLYFCKSFLAQTPKTRNQTVKKHKLCPNCLKGGHTASQCSLRGCTTCQNKHNTLLHLRDSIKEPPPHSQKSTTPTTSTPSATTLAAQTKKGNRKGVLLSTVLINVETEDGRVQECRAVLDCGSQLHFATERLVKRLGLQTISETLNFDGIARNKHKTQSRVNIAVQSRTSAFSIRIEAFVLPEITSAQPCQFLDVSSWPIPENITLGDPDFNHPNQIDLLIGAENFLQLLAIGQIQLGENLPTLQNTVFGWIVGGRVANTDPSEVSCGICSHDSSDLTEKVQNFWQQDEIEVSSTLTNQERICEELFTQTTTRDKTGRFIVSLPFSKEPNLLGQSGDVAFQRFLALERKLNKDADLKQLYNDFMKEYLQLGHMEEINILSVTKPYYFMPHHGILRPDSTTTKLRVVFDASAKTSTNFSLNEVLHTGPSLQDDVFTVLLRFRLPKFVFTADVEKMYRQIVIRKEDRKFQLILWRDNPNQPIKYYQLSTVTYGVTTAPYLAIKCLRQLASEKEGSHPLGATAIRRHMYVDDVMAGSNNLPECIAMQTEINEILQRGGFKLRKWCANHKQLLQTISSEDQAPNFNVQDENNYHIKTLGLTWLPTSDSFHIRTFQANETRVTKRTVSSDIAHLFDPLGIMSPVIIKAKIFLQSIWALNLHWDAAVPMEMHSSWVKFRTELQTLEDITFPRHVLSSGSPRNIQLHTFSDASETAYGAAMYVRSEQPNGTVIVRLLCAKSKVAPMKKISLPRLELQGAALAAKLATRVKEDLHWKDLQSTLWTDSEIVLSWLRNPSSSYQTYVANRVAAIQESTSVSQWRHVPSKDNPADLVSRGITPSKLKTNTLWFYGPLYLHGAERAWPQNPKFEPTTLEMKRPKTVLAATTSNHEILSMVNHQNSFKRLQRITAYDLTALTPGHFLIGEPLTSVAEPTDTTRQENLHQQWKRILHVKNQFWQRWNKEYLAELQHRNKWKQRCQNVEPGAMVIIKDNNLPPLKWPLGRIVQTITGSDGLVRVADVKTASGILRRPIHNLAPLPIDSGIETPKAEADLPTEGNGCQSSPARNTRSSDKIQKEATPRNREQNEGPSSSKKPRKGYPLLALLIAVCFVLPTRGEDNINITPFKTSPGLYFEQLGITRLSSDEWNIVVHYNMVNYWRELRTIEKGLSTLNYICTQLLHDKSCVSSLSQFSSLERELEGNIVLLRPLVNSRQRRAPLNIIGNIASSLFGVLDESYAAEMSDTIKGLEGNDQRLLQLLQNQTSIIDSTMNIMKKSQEAIKRQLQEFDDYFNKTITEFHQIKVELHEQKLTQCFNTMLMRLLLMITNYQRVQSALLDAIIDTHHGKFNPQILTPPQLRQQMILIKEHLPSTLQLPGGQRELLKLYGLMTTEGRVLENQIIFRVKLPLLSHDRFEMLKVIPVPIWKDNRIITIAPTTPYIIVNLHRDLYYPISEPEVARCVITDSSEFICKQQYPIYRKGARISTCELSILMEQGSLSSCLFVTSIESPRWIQLSHANHWIYVMMTETSINIVCGNSVFVKTLLGVGLLNIKKGCNIKDDTIILQTKNIYSSNAKTSIIPGRDIADIIEPNNTSTTWYHSRIPQNLTTNLEAIQQDIKRLHDAESKLKIEANHNIHHYSLGYVSLIIIIIISSYLFWKYYTKRRQLCERMRPMPAPRRLSDHVFRIDPEIQL